MATPAAILALLLADPAAWAEPGREPVCIYDGLAAPGAGAADAARVGAIRSRMHAALRLDRGRRAIAASWSRG